MPCFLLLALAACGSANGESKAAAKSGEDDSHIACAPNGAEKFAKDCVVERSQDQGKLLLTVSHPDGGFRRFEVMTDGTGLATADGAEEAKVAVAEDGMLDVSVGVDRYRFPATVKAGAQDKPEGADKPDGAVKDDATGD